MAFEFRTAGRVIFGKGAYSKLPKLLNESEKVFIVTGASALKASGRLDELLGGLESTGVKYELYCAQTGEPTVESVDEAVRAGKRTGAGIILGIGGGSVLDTAKAAAGLIPNEGSVLEYLEGVGTGAKLKNDPLPFIAVPTTAGTGTETTKNAVITSRSAKFKKSFRDDRLLADIALVDPELTASLPKSITASSGMDAICQLVESFTAIGANAFCDAMALYHVPNAIKALRRAYEDGGDMEAREAVSLASLTSGMCLATAGLGAAHGIGAGLGAILGTPHGVACGMLLPHVIRYNTSRGVTKYAALAEALFKRKFTDAKSASLAFADAVEELCGFVALPVRLRELEVTADMAEELALASMGSSMSKNPVKIDAGECEDFIASII